MRLKASTAITSAVAPEITGLQKETAVADSKDLGQTTVPQDESDREKNAVPVNDHNQEGVERIEAITSTWSWQALATVLCFIYIFTFMQALFSSATGQLAAYVTSSFHDHSLISTVSVLSSVIGGVAKFPIAKILDVRGRIEGFILMTVFCTLGLLLTASCTNVETYAAGQVFYAIGSGGMSQCITIFLADITQLKNRMIAYGLNSTPYIATTFAGPALASRYLGGAGWRWAYGSFAIITPVVALPIITIFLWFQMQAKKTGALPVRATSGRTWWQSLAYYWVQFDGVGLFLVTAGFCILLVPFTLASTATHRWNTGWIIAMIVVGCIVLVAFVIWEKYFATAVMVPWRFLKDRTVLGSCIFAFFLYLTFYCWDLYYSSYLQVVHNLSVSKAGYVVNIYSIISCFWGPIAGLFIRWTGRFKWLAIAAVPVSCLGTALMIYFRHPGAYIGYICMCQVLISVSGGTLVMCEQIAIMAPVTHNEVAMVLALEGVFAAIGGSVGQSISGAMWSNYMPQKLVEFLPASEKANAMTIYGSLPEQLSYPWGSEARNAIIDAYGFTQRRMLIVAAALYPITFFAVFMWRNINLNKIQQTRGTVF
ncbi:uncharacterized protein K452DRAFT_273631 [Aplosporella prunicola CBS 121167]|uniref:Major facilitator superfamily (MFS) profile domain-containing protein n=1 Tax=Aplosporella prunicola CBS 121167 TaxID=1176127 RepID=A0A6A6B9W6_9PEZI|nr:uncharacterized protein K452DRAFT_273631 [Aplosporella prunicola CBS 121167]KAF2140105.1 hypothetical protein K452DRAFT_273631 [Aplosporella prunicola CBS 121167]